MLTCQTVDRSQFGPEFVQCNKCYEMGNNLKYIGIFCLLILKIIKQNVVLVFCTLMGSCIVFMPIVFLGLILFFRNFSRYTFQSFVPYPGTKDFHCTRAKRTV